MIGETVDIACIWLDGRETPEQRRQYEQDVNTVLLDTARQKYVLGPLSWTEKRPGEPRVPPVPPHIDGPDVRLLLVEAVVLAERLSTRTPVGFVHDLEPGDLALLRRVTRRRYEAAYPGRTVTDRQCDTLINDLGPAAATDTLRGLRRSDLH